MVPILGVCSLKESLRVQSGTKPGGNNAITILSFLPFRKVREKTTNQLLPTRKSFQSSQSKVIILNKPSTNLKASGGTKIILSQEDFLVFFEMSTGGSLCLGFHSFWHLLCLECFSHSAMFVDRINNIGIISKHILYFWLSFSVVAQKTHCGDYHDLEYILQRPLFLMVWMLTYGLRS